MIAVRKSTESGLEVLDAIVPGCWINVVDPTTDEIEYLTSQGVPQDFITYPLDLDEQSRTEREDDGTQLVLLRVPFFQGAKVDVPYITIPLGIILTDRFIVTVCRKQYDILQEFATGRVRGLSTNKRNRFVLRLLLATAGRYLSYLREINRLTDALEDQLQLSQQNREVLELLKMQKSLVYFTTALKANELMMERLQRSQLFRMYPDDEDLLEDVITENQQAIEMVNISSNILSSMMDAFASIISNNLNGVMKFLASMTVVVSLPAIITGFYGMNIQMPLQDSPYAIWLVLALVVAVTVSVIIWFWRRRWF